MAPVHIRCLRYRGGAPKEIAMVKTMLALATTLFLAGALHAQDGGKIPWNHDVAAAMKEARKSGKPMLMFFTSDG
jgi:type IV secretory pathway TrbD component